MNLHSKRFVNVSSISYTYKLKAFDCSDRISDLWRIKYMLLFLNH